MHLRRLIAASAAFATAASMQHSNECRRVPFILFGAGGVGNALLDTIAKNRDLHSKRYDINFVPLAVVDSSAAVSGTGDAGGLTDAEVTALISHKEAGGKLSAHTAVAGEKIASRPDSQSAADFLSSVVDQYATSEPNAM